MERNTRQRTAMREAIAAAARPLLPQEVMAAAQAGAPGLGLATVYRNLRSMVDDGTLRQVMLPGETPRYELADHGHHHHFQCLSCQRVFDVHACPGDLAGLAPSGFTVEAHDLTLYGRCGDCARVGAGTVAHGVQDCVQDGVHGGVHDGVHGGGHGHGSCHGHEGHEGRHGAHTAPAAGPRRPGDGSAPQG